MAAIITGKCEGEIDVKRFYLPGVKLTFICAKCKAKHEQDFDRSHYLSYPEMNVPLEYTLYCPECSFEEKIMLQLDVSLKIIRSEEKETTVSNRDDADREYERESRSLPTPPKGTRKLALDRVVQCRGLYQTALTLEHQLMMSTQANAIGRAQFAVLNFLMSSFLSHCREAYNSAYFAVYDTIPEDLVFEGKG